MPESSAAKKESPFSLISEPLKPQPGTFDPTAMARGEPGLPSQFLWKKRKLVITEVLERWKEHGDCTHGSGERYLRKHGFRVRTEDDLVLRIYFHRNFGGSAAKRAPRWWLQGIERS
ncbi:hypothetical protein BH09VER1_BH09VER1_16600 [soil metagenome]